MATMPKHARVGDKTGYAFNPTPGIDPSGEAQLEFEKVPGEGDWLLEYNDGVYLRVKLEDIEWLEE